MKFWSSGAVAAALSLLTLCQAAVAADAKPSFDPKSADPQRFFAVKQWSGTIQSGAASAGSWKDDIWTVTYKSELRVEARFTVAPFIDERNGDRLSWRGKGEAHIRVTGEKRSVTKDEILIETFSGDYVDSFSVWISNIKVDKGTYEIGVSPDLWMQQAHRGKAIRHTTVTIRPRHTTKTVEMDPGYAWANDAGAGFGGQHPLPKEGFVINGKLTSKNQDFLSRDGSRWDTTWQMQPVDPEFQEPLKAVAGGPYKGERGATIALDGWKSTGKIRSYKWTFEPIDAKSTIPVAANATKNEKRSPTVFLTSMKATLTVSDGQKEDSDSTLVTIAARDYTTPFVHHEEEKKHPNSIPPRMIKGRDLRYAGGENVCALCSYSSKDSVHMLHPPAKAGTWEKKGYDLVQVKDAGGPFDGVWYVDNYQMRIDREVLINKYILDGGPPPVRTAQPFYKANKALGLDVDAYLAAVRRHELLHSTLAKAALAKNDPGPQLEPLAAKEKEALQKQADKLITDSEAAIDKASADPLPSVNYKGKIAVPDDATDKYVPVDLEF